MTTIGNCGRCSSLLEKGDLRCAVCGIGIGGGAHSMDHVHAQIMRCDECGAAVSYDLESQAPKCAFCGAGMHVEQIEDPLEQTEAFLPFAVNETQARDALGRWLGTLGFFRPSDLTSNAQLDSLRPLYWVAWIFEAQSLISWTVDSDHGSDDADWAPHAGQNDLAFNHILVSASRGLTDKETQLVTPSYNLTTANEGPHGPPTAIIEQFDVQRSQAREKIASVIEGIAADDVTRNCAPGKSFRNLHVKPLVKSLVTRRYALPAYVMAYRYKGNVYRAVVSGQSTDFVTGTAPYSFFKIAVVLGAFAILALIVIIATA